MGDRVRLEMPFSAHISLVINFFYQQKIIEQIMKRANA